MKRWSTLPNVFMVWLQRMRKFGKSGESGVEKHASKIADACWEKD